MSFHDAHSSLQDGVHKLLSCPSPCAMQVLCILSFSPTRLCSFFFLVSWFWVWKFSLQSNACMNYGGFGCWNQKSKGKGKHLLLWVGSAEILWAAFYIRIGTRPASPVHRRRDGQRWVIFFSLCCGWCVLSFFVICLKCIVCVEDFVLMAQYIGFWHPYLLGFRVLGQEYRRRPFCEWCKKNGATGVFAVKDFNAEEVVLQEPMLVGAQHSSNKVSVHGQTFLHHDFTYSLQSSRNPLLRNFWFPLNI